MTKKPKTRSIQTRGEHRRRPMRAALRPISPRCRMGRRRGRAPPACPTSQPRCHRHRQPALPTKPQRLLFRPHRADDARRRRRGRGEAEAAAVLLCRGGKRRHRLARPPVRLPALSARLLFLLIVALGFTSPLALSGLSDGVTDGGRPLCLQTRSPNDVPDVAKKWFRYQVSVTRNYIPLRASLSNLGAG